MDVIVDGLGEGRERLLKLMGIAEKVVERKEKENPEVVWETRVWAREEGRLSTPKWKYESFHPPQCIICTIGPVQGAVSRSGYHWLGKKKRVPISSVIKIQSVNS